MKSDKVNTGDIVRVYTKDPGDSKVHVTPFEGIVISQKGILGSQTFSVRKKSTAGVFIERIFPVDSPMIEKIIVVKKGEFRRSKLYFLRKKR